MEAVRPLRAGAARALSGPQAALIDGKAQAAILRGRIAGAVERLKADGVQPGLAVVIVGDHPASRLYVGAKKRATVEAGMRSIDHALPADTGEAELVRLVGALNADEAVDGILVQLPLPSAIDAERIVAAIDPDKDVDGFHPLNAGRLALGLPGLRPCTPLGCLMLIRSIRPDLSGLDAVVLGRSTIVGRPVAQMLTAADGTVTVAHSRTRDLPGLCRRADILVAAVGRPEMVRGSWIKPGAIVIDVGINRVPDPRDPARTRLVGDVAFAEAEAVAGALTPVPGGVGPMTIACLLRNTVEAACRRRGLPVPAL